MRKKQWVSRWVEITQDQMLFYKKNKEKIKIKQLINLLESKLEQGVERHLADDGIQEVIDFRYYKITYKQDNGLEQKLMLRFNKYQDYREWGQVLLEATMTNEALYNKLNEHVLQELEKKKQIESEQILKRKQEETQEKIQRQKELIDDYCGLFLEARQKDLDKTLKEFQGSWSLGLTVSQVQVYMSRPDINLSGNLQVASDSFREIKNSRLMPTKLSRDPNAYLFAIGSMIGINLIELNNVAKVMLILLVLFAIAAEEYKYKQSKIIKRAEKIKFNLPITPIFLRQDQAFEIKLQTVVENTPNQIAKHFTWPKFRQQWVFNTPQEREFRLVCDQAKGTCLIIEEIFKNQKRSSKRMLLVEQVKHKQNFLRLNYLANVQTEQDARDLLNQFVSFRQNLDASESSQRLDGTIDLDKIHQQESSRFLEEVDEEIGEDSEQDNMKAIDILGSLIDKNIELIEGDGEKQSDETLLPVMEEDFEDEIVPNIRLSMKQQVRDNEDEFTYAMNFLYKNFSHASNEENFSDVVLAPDSIKPEAVLRPSVKEYQPPENIMHFKVGNFSQRLIFYRKPVNWDTTEQTHLDKFYNFCKEKSLHGIPKWYLEPEIIRQLHAESFNYQKTYNAIVAQIVWRETKLPMMLEDIHTQILKSGVIFIHGRDIYHRPIFHLKPLQACKLGFASKVDETIRVICFAVFYMFKHMCLEGKVENNLNIIDLEHAKPWQLPVKTLHAFQSELAAQFKCTGERNFVVNSSTPFVWAWNTIKNILNEGQRAKTVLVGEKTCKEITDMCCPCQLLEDYGGNAKYPERWWPPTVPPICNNHKQPNLINKK